MSEINLGQVVGPRGFQGIQGVKGDKGDQGIQGVVGPKVDVAASLGTSTVYAVSQKLLTDEVDKMTTTIATIKSQSDASIVKVDNADTKIDTKTSELLTSILGINKKLTNRINALEESSISNLFNNGDGIWLDPSDLKTLFQNSSGTTPVTKDGDPVGLILDKSQGTTGKVLTGDGSVTPEKYRGLPVDQTGAMRIEGSGSYRLNESTDVMLKAGVTYKITVRVIAASDVNYGYRTYHTNSNSAGSYNFSSYSRGVVGENVRYMTPDIDGYFGIIKLGSHTGYEIIDKIDVQEVKGNHASQPLAASRPTYRTDGVLHWLSFDGVDDKLDVNVAATNNFDLSLSFNYLDISAGARGLVTHNINSTFIFGSAANGNFNLFTAADGRLEDTDRRNKGIKVITSYLSSTESRYIGQSGNLNNLPTGLTRTVNSLTIGGSATQDIYGFIFKDSSQFYPDRSRQLHSYMQRKAGEEIQ